MGRRKILAEPVVNSPNDRKTPPDISSSAIEKRLIAKSYAEAERRIDNGTATSEMICLFLKAGSSKQFIEEQKAQAELDYTRAKVALVESQIKTEEMFTEAMKSMRIYHGDIDDVEDPNV